MRTYTKYLRIKLLFFLLVFFIAGGTGFSQSVLTLEPGTSMGVLTGADLCVNIRNGTGILYGGGTVCGGLVAIDPVAGNEIPLEFALLQNYPNPFNPVTSIGLRIAETGFVSLKVFDITGKQVAALVNQELKAGIYNVDFDASHLASGTYFYRLVVGELRNKSGNTNNGVSFSDVKKMILIK